MFEKEAVNAGAKGNAYGLSIAERFYLLAVIIESSDPDKVSRAYGILTGLSGKKKTTDYIRDICSDIDLQHKYKKGRRKKSEAEKAETKRRYYLEHREETIARAKKRRQENPEKYREYYLKQNAKRKNKRG